MKTPTIYIVANTKSKIIYTGATSDLPKRIFEHKHTISSGFSNRYGCKDLVYYEAFDNMENAIQREKQIKSWSRERKIKMIESFNENWNDLYGNIC